MNIKSILNQTEHRPWVLPKGKWSFYQEWNKAIFLHWKEELKESRKYVPAELEIDTFNSEAWVSMIAFRMERIRPRWLPAFPPVSNFDELNIRTYVKHGGKTGVYFLSIEAAKSISCQIAKSISGLPYRYSKIERTSNSYSVKNSFYKDVFTVNFAIGEPHVLKDDLGRWLTERYALFQDTKDGLSQFEIHHMEWPLMELEIGKLKIDYPRFKELLKGDPD